MQLIDYSVGQSFNGCLAVKQCNVRQTNQNPPRDYLDLLLTDGDSEIRARVWEHEGPVPAENSVIFVSARITQFRGEQQLNISAWRPAGQEEYHPQDFLPVTPCDTDILKKQLQEYILQVKDGGLGQMLDSIFAQHYDHFVTAPAAMVHHHAYVGGLLEHTCGVASQCLRLVTPETDQDILLTGAILHDVAKIFDYDWSGCVVTMTDAGRLLGHIAQGMMLINNHAANCPDLSTERLEHLLHLIASHHGKLEWGSPVEPCTLEAVLLHNADMLDVHLWKLGQALDQVPEGEQWTGFVKGLNRRFFKVNSSGDGS